jgi:hypothetical protein
MIAIGIVLGLMGLAYLCSLLFTLAVHALPLFAGVTAGFAAYHSGSGAVAAIIVGAIAGILVLVIGQIAFATLQSPILRAAVGLLFATPAAMAGYHAALGLAQIIVLTSGLQDALAIAGAITVAATAWVRMAHVRSPDAGRGVAAGQDIP